ncbi:unnamed protein product [Macrosiphum euphorbiae]|uniref:Uncharacterized protein n=1 Tax=Macrosiphum euphorbiae TaxID=13131 RepID=A0AAV0XA05_9HEMI|nr:unnamed protein product [Macrosiphum euphorbiae]
MFLVGYNQPLPKYYLARYEDRVAHLYKTLIKFLDDQDIQQSILDLLIDLSWMKHGLLFELLDVNVPSQELLLKHLIDMNPLLDDLSQMTLHTNNTE